MKTKANVRHLPKPPAMPPRPRPTPVYRPAEGERLQDGESSKVDYEVRIRLEGLAEEPTEADFPPQPPAWFPAILMFMIGFTAGVFVASLVLSP